MMTLHGYWRSSASYRVRLALGLKGIEVNHQAVTLKSGAHLLDSHKALNMQPFVPVLELEDGTKLTQSLAIIDYLEEVYPEPALLPADPVLKAKVRAAAQIIAADIAPIQNLRVLKFIRAEHSQDDNGVKAWAAHWIAEGFKSLEALVQEDSYSHIKQDKLGYFECCLIPQIYNAFRFGVNMDVFPKLMGTYYAANQHPAFLNAAPENQHDAPSEDHEVSL